MYRTVVLDGEMSLIMTMDGDCSLEIPESGECGVITAINSGALPAYTGATRVVPFVASEQILETAMTTVTENITVEKIPVHVTSNLQGGNTVYIGGDISYG